MKEHAAAIVPNAAAGLVDENSFRTRNRDTGRIERETRETIVIRARVEGRWANGWAADNRGGRHPRVVNEDVMICRKAGMKGQVEQALIVPALTLVADVEDERFCASVGIVNKRPDATFAFPHEKASIAGHSSEAESVGKHQIRKSDHGGPVAGNRRRGF